MIKRKQKQLTGKRGFLSLNRQFCLVVIVGIIASYFVLNLALLVINPLVGNMYPRINKLNETLAVIGEEVYSITDSPTWSITDNDTIAEFDTIIDQYPQFDFEYEIFLGIDRKTFELQGMIEETKLEEDRYVTTVFEASNGVVVVGISIPELQRFGTLLSIGILLLFMTSLLIIIGVYASRKVRYLKTITKNLEIIAGGDLNIKIPLKGRDEIFQVAWHINEMATALQNEIEKEKKVDEIKKQLITNISHDLRTPLTAIIGYMSILDSMKIEDNNEKVKQYIHRAYEKSNGLSRLVDQLFDYVLLSNQQIKFTFEAVEPSIYFRQIFTELESILETKGIDMVYELENSDQPIQIDCNQFMRVIENLIQNIQKYARTNTQVKVKGNKKEHQYVVSISNESGEVLEEGNEFLSRYFTTDRSSQKSAGLGLAICKELVEQQKGSFSVDAHQKQFKAIIELPCRE